MIMLPFGAQVTGKRESLLENHVLNRKDTLISDFPLLVVRIHPAARQALAGEKYHVGLAKAGRVRHFLARVEPALEFIPERIKEGFDVHHLDDITARNMPQKHGTSFCFRKAAGSGMPAAPGCGETVRAPQAATLIAYSLMGRGKAVKISFLALDRPDQLDFFGLAGFQSLMSGELAYLLDFHVRLLAKCEKFQRDICPLLKSWRGRCIPALTDINNSILIRQHHRPGVQIRS
jgi:hypothetical protein